MSWECTKLEICSNNIIWSKITFEAEEIDRELRFTGISLEKKELTV